MAESVCLTRDILNLSSLLGENIGLVALDQEDAFDSVEQRFLQKKIERFGSSTDFIATMQVLRAMLKINCSLCTPFRVQKGVQ